MRFAPLLLLLLGLCAATAACAQPALTVHHDLVVGLDPQAGTLEVRDRLTLPAPLAGDELRFALHGALRVTGPSGVQGLGETNGGDGVPVRRYRLALDEGQVQVELRYGGRIVHTLGGDGERKGGRRDTPGLISPEGVYLGPESRWYPHIDGAGVQFRLTVHAPEGWRGISQGRRGADTPAHAGRWRTRRPQQGIHLVANRFTRYSEAADWGEALVYLRRPDRQLARRYLRATREYVRLYNALIGAYPYPKFALVENFWESGYGMPSFTLMGPRVLRLPFIVHTSYPHEVLHNWWGNGVYVGEGGNWAEALTAYLADHLFAEQRGEGAAHRRDTLQQYADFVRASEDFPLRAFRGRHGAVTQAVGYSKGLMVFHMLRRRLGDRAFLHGLRRFYRTHRFQRAGFDDLRAALEPESDAPLSALFHQWLDRPGAPALAVEQVKVQPQDDGRFTITGRLVQTQPAPPYRLRVPLVVQLAGNAEPRVQTVSMDSKEHAFHLTVSERPLRLAVDPAFDVFRRLDRGELPAAFSQLLGHRRAVFVLPAATDASRLTAYRRLANRWATMYARARVVLDSDLARLPGDRAVWVLGWRNGFRNAVAEHLGHVELDETRAHWQGETYHRGRHTVALAARTPAPAHQPLAWVASDNIQAFSGLARKLPHYGKFSYVVFEGGEPAKIASGQWPVTDSPLYVDLVADIPPLALPQRPALTQGIEGDGTQTLPN